MISGAGLCWQHVGGVGSTTTTTTFKIGENYTKIDFFLFIKKEHRRFIQNVKAIPVES